MLKKIFELLKKILPLFFKIAGTGYLIYYLGFKVDWKAFLALLPQINIAWLLLAVGGYLLKIFFEATKWHILNKAYTIEINFLKLYRYKIIGPAFDLLTPVPQGEDVFKFYLLEKTSGNIGKAVIIPLFSKVMGLSGIVVLLPFTIFYFTEKLNLDVVQQLIFKGALVAVPLILLLYFFGNSLLKILYRYSFFANNWPKLLQLLNVLKENPLMVSKVFVIGFAAHLSFVVTLYALAATFNIYVPYWYWLVGLPLIYVSAMAPLTAGGIGQKEAVILWLLLQQGVALHVAQSVALLHLSMMLGFVISGFILYFFEE
jgi:uncharacterized membrane protein YbhN (UPF0104 family)